MVTYFAALPRAGLDVGIAFQPVSGGEPHSLTKLFSHSFQLIASAQNCCVFTIGEAVVTIVKLNR